MAGRRASARQPLCGNGRQRVQQVGVRASAARQHVAAIERDDVVAGVLRDLGSVTTPGRRDGAVGRGGRKRGGHGRRRRCRERQRGGDRAAAMRFMRSSQPAAGPAAGRRACRGRACGGRSAQRRPRASMRTAGLSQHFGPPHSIDSNSTAARPGPIQHVAPSVAGCIHGVVLRPAPPALVRSSERSAGSRCTTAPRRPADPEGVAHPRAGSAPWLLGEAPRRSASPPRDERVR